MPDRVIRARSPLGRGSKPRVENDVWHTLGVEPGEDPLRIPRAPIIVPLAVWKARRNELLWRHDPLGVWLAPEEDAAELVPDFGRLAVIAVHFPKFADGRGYSTGTLLRTRHGWRGELRAFGDIGRDHLLQLARCGFDSFRLPDHRDPEAALAAFDEFTVLYQGAVDDPLPLYRKRFGVAA